MITARVRPQATKYESYSSIARKVQSWGKERVLREDPYRFNIILNLCCAPAFTGL